MHLFLRHAPGGDQAPRFVQLSLQPDLFGGWLLLRERGEIGGRTTLRRELHPDQPTALAALQAARDAQLKRGFEVVADLGAPALS